VQLNTVVRHHLGQLALAGAVLLAGCHTNTDSGSANPAPTVKDAAQEHVDAFGAELGRLLSDHAADAHGKGGLAQALGRRSADLQRPNLVGKLLAHDGQSFRFVRHAALTAHGKATFAAVEAAPAHGLDPATLKLPRLEAAIQRLEAASTGVRGDDVPQLTDARSEELASLLRERAPASREEAATILLTALVADGTTSPAPEVTTWYRGLVERMANVAELAADVEVMLTDVVLQYALMMRYANPRALPDEALAGKGPAAATDDQLLGFGARVRDLGSEGADNVNDAVAAEFARLQPSTPQYGRLVEALARYRTIQAAGGWPTVWPDVPAARGRTPGVKYSASSKHLPESLVRITKERLAAEGFYSGAIDDRWTDDLNAALLDYRAVHQLWNRPWIDAELIDAMKLPIEYRIAQIELTLQRWRESRVGGDDYYILVNIPDFHAEVWDGGKRAMRFRVIVGKANRYKDRSSGEWVYPNATPRFSARMESVVFAPYWNVPYRIKTRELDGKLDKSPTWYEDNNYEVYTTGSGQEMVRQRPGPGNALGRVKLLFPNDHDVYIHDTQDKTLFANPVRAYSHGCMRAEEPLALAEYVLSRESEFWNERRVRSYGAAHSESWQRLERGPMVHIEYYTVRVDDAGKVNFLADVYQLDAERIFVEKGLDAGLSR